jgi:hypothetical protein
MCSKPQVEAKANTMIYHSHYSTKVDAEILAKEQAELVTALHFSMEQLRIDEQRSTKQTLCSGKGKCPLGTCNICVKEAGPEVLKKDDGSSGEDLFTDAQSCIDLFGNRVWFKSEPRPDFAYAGAVRRVRHDRNGRTVPGESSKGAPTRKAIHGV